MIYVGYKTIDPAPESFDPPACYAPYFVAIWLALGIGLLVAMKLRGREEWLLNAGQAAYEQPGLPAEGQTAALPGFAPPVELGPGEE